MIRKIVRDEKASVSIYLLIILSALLLMGLVFIDFARIAIGKIKVEKAVQLSASAALSYYDSDLARKYGLFGLNTNSEKSDEIFTKYLEKNLTYTSNTLGIKYLINKKKTYIEGVDKLNEYLIFKAEMIKAIKYKASVSWIKKIKESLTVNKLNELENVNNEGKTARDRKRELNRQLSDLKIKLKEAAEENKGVIQKEIERITLEIGDKSKSYTIPRISSAGSIESLLLSRVSETLGFSKNLVTKTNEEDSIVMSATNFNDLEKWPPKMFDLIKGIIISMESATQKGAEKLFIVEYIADRMSNLTNEKEDREYKKGEMEYILNANPRASELESVSTSLLKIWLFRFALNFVSDFSKSAIPEPFERFLFNLAKASMEASTDILTLINGGSVEIFPGIVKNIKLNYVENLKLMLLCCSEEQLIKQTYRLINGTNLNIRNIEISEYSSLLKINYKVGIKLLFIPVLHLDILSDKFKDGCFYYSDEVCFGY